MYELRVVLKEEFFDALPSYNDPTGPSYHDYHLSIPSIYIGVPYNDSIAPLSGKVYWTLGRATDLVVTHSLSLQIEPTGAKLITEKEVQDLRSASVNPNGVLSRLETFWQSLNASVDYTWTDIDTKRLVTYALAPNVPLFPAPKDPSLGPDDASLFLLTKADAPQLKFGSTVVTTAVRLEYKDFAGTTKQASASPAVYRVQAKGAFIDVQFESTLVTPTDVPLADQTLHVGQTGLMRATVSATNVGSDVGYRVNFMLDMAPNVDIDYERLEVAYSVHFDGLNSTLTLATEQNLPPGDIVSIPIYIRYSTSTRTRQLMAASRFLPMPLITGVTGTIDLTSTPNERRVTQALKVQLTAQVSRTAPSPTPSAEIIVKCSGTKQCTLQLVTDYQGPARVVWRRRYSASSRSQYVTLGVTSGMNFTDPLPTSSQLRSLFDYQGIRIQRTLEVFYSAGLHVSASGDSPAADSNSTLPVIAEAAIRFVSFEVTVGENVSVAVITPTPGPTLLPSPTFKVTMNFTIIQDDTPGQVFLRYLPYAAIPVGVVLLVVFILWTRKKTRAFLARRRAESRQWRPVSHMTWQPVEHKSPLEASLEDISIEDDPEDHRHRSHRKHHHHQRLSSVDRLLFALSFPNNHEAAQNGHDRSQPRAKSRNPFEWIVRRD